MFCSFSRHVAGSETSVASTWSNRGFISTVTFPSPAPTSSRLPLQTSPQTSCAPALHHLALSGRSRRRRAKMRAKMRAKRGGGCAPRPGACTLASVEKDAGIFRVKHVHLVHAEHSVCIGVRHDQPCSVSCPRPRHCMGWVCLEKVKCPLRKRGSSREALELSVGAGLHSLITRAGRHLYLVARELDKALLEPLVELSYITHVV